MKNYKSTFYDSLLLEQKQSHFDSKGALET